MALEERTYVADGSLQLLGSQHPAVLLQLLPLPLHPGLEGLLVLLPLPRLLLTPPFLLLGRGEQIAGTPGPLSGFDSIHDHKTLLASIIESLRQNILDCGMLSGSRTRPPAFINPDAFK